MNDGMRNLRRVRRIVWVLAVALSTGGAAANGAFRAGNGKIAFVGKRSQIYVVDPSGEHQRRLTDSASEKSSPAFSPDGRRLAFAHLRLDPSRESHFQISIMDADARHQHQLTHGRADSTAPSFSPSGSRLAFVRAGSIYVMRADGSHTRLVTKRGRSPAYSRDGRRIVFEGSDTVPGDAGTPREKSGIFIVDVDGRRRRALTLNPMGPPDAYGTSEPRHIDRDPSFSPDGKSIVFVRSPNGCLSGSIYVMRASGRGVRAVTHGSGCDKFYAPALSPDGQELVSATAGGLYVMRADGTERRKLPVSGDTPDWQPRPR